ncbi:hypothetical protein BU111_10705 [Staphylococcus xylosus]|nr:hypothetical protein BU099_06275 [Staphylococcus xylosus]PTI50232.1 hypothetical protein BU111_10705 [Staphylococcus xylosus]PTI56148.1 hypothetical protein BU106_00330 [Staphylococcus xylosus]
MFINAFITVFCKLMNIHKIRFMIEWDTPLGIGLRGYFCGFKIVCEKWRSKCDNLEERFSENGFKSKVIDNHVHATNEILRLLVY